ncbi:MAG: two-component sensor histidine kinase, partial [Rhodobacteraceae bacterium]|nr:two-component sensor histidine kinase [Paracoccaceae bacterium]
MFFQWLKRYMPRSLYGRAALILILPVVTLQLVVSFVFIQRHFEDVTEQMTRTVSRELVLLLDAVDASHAGRLEASQLAGLADALDYTLEIGATVPPGNQRRWYDFSGLVVIRTLNDLVPAIRGVELPDNRVVRVYAATGQGPALFEFDRLRLSASNPHQLLVNMVFFGGLMTLIAFLYLRNQLRPVKRLAAAAEAFGRGRHVPYSPTGAVEVRAA